MIQVGSIVKILSLSGYSFSGALAKVMCNKNTNYYKVILLDSEKWKHHIWDGRTWNVGKKAVVEYLETNDARRLL